MKKRRLRASRDASFSVTTLSLVCVSSKPSPADEEHSSCFNKFRSKPRVPSCACIISNSAYDNDRWLTIFLDIAGFCSPAAERKNQIAQLLSKVTVNCALWTQLTLRLHPRHCDTNIFPMSQSAKYNLGAGWAGHRIKRTGWEHSMGLTLVLVAIHLCRITSSFPKRQADQEILRQVRLSPLKNFASFATKLWLWG